MIDCIHASIVGTSFPTTSAVVLSTRELALSEAVYCNSQGAHWHGPACVPNRVKDLPLETRTKCTQERSIPLPAVLVKLPDLCCNTQERESIPLPAVLVKLPDLCCNTQPPRAGQTVRGAHSKVRCAADPAVHSDAWVQEPYCTQSSRPPCLAKQCGSCSWK